jgi:hypothetical protein
MEVCRDLVYLKQWKLALRAASDLFETEYVFGHMLDANLRLTPDGNTCPYHPYVGNDGNANGDSAGWGTGDGNGNSNGFAGGDGDGDSDGSKDGNGNGNNKRYGFEPPWWNPADTVNGDDLF